MNFPLGGSRADAHSRGEAVWELYRRSGMRAPRACLLAQILADVVVFATQESGEAERAHAAAGSRLPCEDEASCDEAVAEAAAIASRLLASD